MDGKVLQDAVIVPNHNWSAVLTPGQTLRIVDLQGKQAVDFLCYNADDVADRYNAADTMKYNKNVYLGAGHGIYSVRATKLFTGNRGLVLLGQQDRRRGAIRRLESATAAQSDLRRARWNQFLGEVWVNERG